MHMLGALQGSSPTSMGGCYRHLVNTGDCCISSMLSVLRASSPTSMGCCYRHVVNTGDIGDFCITHVSSVSQGVRRIVAVTGSRAVQVLHSFLPLCFFKLTFCLLCMLMGRIGGGWKVCVRVVDGGLCVCVCVHECVCVCVFEGMGGRDCVCVCVYESVFERMRHLCVHVCKYL